MLKASAADGVVLAFDTAAQRRTYRRPLAQLADRCRTRATNERLRGDESDLNLANWRATREEARGIEAAGQASAICRRPPSRAGQAIADPPTPPALSAPGTPPLPSSATDPARGLPSHNALGFAIGLLQTAAASWVTRQSRRAPTDRIGQSNLAPVGYDQAGGCLWRWVLAGRRSRTAGARRGAGAEAPRRASLVNPGLQRGSRRRIAPAYWPVCGSVRGEVRMGEVPKQLTVGSDQPGVFEHQPDLFAVEVSDGDTAEAVAVVEDSNERFVVYGRQSARRSTTTSRLPVYAADGGPLAVPTGRVLVRLEAGESVQARAESFRSVGFEIDHLLSYAPHAAWLRPTAGGVAEALAGLDTLARLPGVAHVEPQLLMERANR